MYPDVYNKALFENCKQMVIGFGLIDVSSGIITCKSCIEAIEAVGRKEGCHC